MLGLKDQRLEHHDRIEWRPSAFGAVAISQPLDQAGLEILEIHRLPQNLERIAFLAQGLKIIVQAEQGLWIHDDAPECCTVSESSTADLREGAFAGVQLVLD